MLTQPQPDAAQDERLLLHAIETIGSAILSTLDLDTILDTLAHQVIDTGLFRSLMVALVDDDAGEIHVVRGLTRYHGLTHMSDKPTVDLTRLDRRIRLDSKDIVADVTRSGRMEIIDGWDERFAEGADAIEAFEDRVSYFIPILDNNRVVAVLGTGSTRAERPALEKRIAFMGPLFDQTGIAIVHARMYGRLKSETELHRRAEERYRALFDNMNAAFAIHLIIEDSAGVPIDFRYEDANAEYLRIAGVPKNELIGRRATAVASALEPDLGMWVPVFGRVTRTGTSTRLVHHAVASDRDFDIIVYRPSPGHFATIVTEVTARKRLEEEIAKRRNLESLGDLAAGIAHEFNNTLASVIGGVSLLKNALPPESDVRDVAELTEEAVMRSKHLTEDLITFSRGGAPRKSDFEIATLVAEVVEAETRDKGIVVNYAADDSELTIGADRTQIRQVFGHLVRNAVEAMPDGGVLEIRVEVVDGPDEVAPALADGRYARISFIDEGMGMTPEVSAAAFGPFFTTKPMAQGLGLSIVDSVTRRHGGAVAIRSRPNAGSTIMVYLPYVLGTSRQDQAQKR